MRVSSRRMLSTLDGGGFARDHARRVSTRHDAAPLALGRGQLMAYIQLAGGLVQNSARDHARNVRLRLRPSRLELDNPQAVIDAVDEVLRQLHVRWASRHQDCAAARRCSGSSGHAERRSRWKRAAIMMRTDLVEFPAVLGKA